MQYLQSGNLQGARRYLSDAVAEHPGYAPAHLALGNCLRGLGQLEQAESALRRALELDQTLFEAWISLAFLLQGAGRSIEAAPLLTELGKQALNPTELQQVAGLLMDFRCYREATEVYSRLTSEAPTAGAYLRLGQCHQKLGRYTEAERAFLEAIARDPNTDAAYLLLAHTRRATPQDEPRLRHFTALLQNGRLSQSTRACLHFALGKWLDDLGRYEEAWEHIAAGNALRREEVPFDRPAWKDYFERLAQAAPPPVASSPAGNPPFPVFIVGMMRSGTTLVERILASYAEVCALGEAELADSLAQATEQITSSRYPECLSVLTAAQSAELAQTYRDHWPCNARQAGLVVDKNPLNFLHLGLIMRVFPQARIIHCQRNPLDTGLSIYFQNFAHPLNGYAYDLKDIGFFWRHYRRLMKHWEHILPAGCLHEIGYEDLVADPEGESRRLLQFLGLAWDPACLEFHKQPGAISTASVWQARQPLYRESVGRWRHYRRHLAPLAMALGMDGLPE